MLKARSTILSTRNLHVDKNPQSLRTGGHIEPSDSENKRVSRRTSRHPSHWDTKPDTLPSLGLMLGRRFTKKKVIAGGPDS